MRLVNIIFYTLAGGIISLLYYTDSLHKDYILVNAVILAGTLLLMNLAVSKVVNYTAYRFIKKRELGVSVSREGNTLIYTIGGTDFTDDTVIEYSISEGESNASKTST